MTQPAIRFQHRLAAGTLPVLACLFLAAGASRLGLGVASVIAAETETAVTNPSTTETDRLLAAFSAREENLRIAEAEIAERQRALEAAEAEIRTQLRALEDAEARLLATLSLTETAAENDVTRLVSVYENMKPQQAAQLFATMDVAFAANFFARLRPDFAGMVLAELDPLQAYAISAVLAGRHASVPKE